jgi:hypothetical protein
MSHRQRHGTRAETGHPRARRQDCTCGALDGSAVTATVTARPCSSACPRSAQHPFARAPAAAPPIHTLWYPCPQGRCRGCCRRNLLADVWRARPIKLVATPVTYHGGAACILLDPTVALGAHPQLQPVSILHRMPTNILHRMPANILHSEDLLFHRFDSRHQRPVPERPHNDV